MRIQSFIQKDNLSLYILLLRIAKIYAKPHNDGLYFSTCLRTNTQQKLKLKFFQLTKHFLTSIIRHEARFRDLEIKIIL